MRAFFLVTLHMAFGLCGHSQPDTLVNINIATGVTTWIRPTAGGPASSNNFTPHSRGLTRGVNPLDARPPATDVMECSAFSNPAQADRLFNLSDFPASTTVKLKIYKNNLLLGQCTGHMVAPRLVLTAAHCLIPVGATSPDGDRFIVIAAFDLDLRKELIGSDVESAYVFKSYLHKKHSDDIILLELSDPIGDHTGWIGIGNSNDERFFEENVFHKFSYPNLQPFERDQPGSSLFYNYGLIDVLPGIGLGISGSPDAIAMSGQSGSSFLFTNEKVFYSVGVAIYSGLYQHYRITQRIFDLFQPIVLQDVASANTIAFTLYPNPVVHTTLLKTSVTLKKYSLIVYDSAGQIVRFQNGGETNSIAIEGAGLEKGVYTFHLADDDGHRAKGKFTVQ